MIMKTELTRLEEKGNFSFEIVDHPTCPGAISWVFKCGGRTSVPFETLLEALTVFTRKVLEVELKPFENPERGMWFARDPQGYTSEALPLKELKEGLIEMQCIPIANPVTYIKTGIDVPTPKYEFTPPSVPVQETPNFGKIMEMFGKAHKSIKYPQIDLFTVEGQSIKLVRAGEKSNKPGSIGVTNGGRYGEGGSIWYGRIMPDGEWKPSRYCPRSITSFLTEFNADPSKTAKIHGHRHGWCCFCGKDLTTKESTTMGYGPICADKYGLPWGQIEE